MEIPELKRFDAEIEPWVCTQCGFCRSVCPVFEQIPWESASPRGKLYYIKQLLKKGSADIDPDFIKRIFQCTLCVRCQEGCQTNIDMMGLWQAVRAELGNRGLLPKSIETMAKTVTEHHNLFAIANTKRNIWALGMEDRIAPKMNKPAKVAYFIGCVASFTGRISGIPAATIDILDASDIDYTILGPDEWCCGNPFFFIGGHEAATETAWQNINKLKELGVEQIITNCAGCYRAFTHEYPRIFGENMKDMGFEILHFSQLLSRLIDEGKLKFNNPQEITVTYHDPCEIGRHLGIYDEPRHVLKSLPGVELVEMSNNRENAECCGGGGLLKAVDEGTAEAIAGKRLDQALKTGADAVISSCVTCKIQLGDAAREKELDLQVLDIAEFTAQFL